MCYSSRKSHRDCYESLGLFIKKRNEGYSDAIRESWLTDIKNELPRQRYSVWVQYAYQLEELDSTGTISDRRLYFNRSSYDKLPALWRKDLDVYLDDCSSRYTAQTLESTRRYCSKGLLFFDDMGVHGITNVTYDAVIKLIEAKMYCSDDTKAMILNNTARMIRFYGEKGLCTENYNLVFNCQIYPHIGLVSGFSDENRMILDKITDVAMSADEFYKSVTPFIELLETHGYVGTTLKLAKHALTGYTDNYRLDACLMSGTAPQDKIPDVLSDGQLQRINTFCAEHNEPIELRDIAIVLLGVRMGLRAYDILALRFQDIDWKNRQISIVMKKTKTQITLPMPVEAGNAMYLYITSGRPKASTEYIFIRSKAPYGKLTGKVCTKALYRILPERKEVKGGGFHVTRRTFATNLLRNHAGIDDVMDALGHRDPTSVMKYLLLDDERSRKCGLSLDSTGILMEEGLA